MSFIDKFAMVSIGAVMAVLQVQFVMGLPLKPLPLEQILQRSEAITVRIYGTSTGSGVIVRRQGNNPICYTVLTNWHVVQKPGNYVVEIGGRPYPISPNQVRPLQGADLAVLNFTSDLSYAPAQLGDSNRMTRGMRVYVTGWANPDRVNPSYRRLFFEGSISEILPKRNNEGYTLRYTNYTQAGMSGGPVLNEQGFVIGINGLAIPNSNPEPRDFLGIPINTFLIWNQLYGGRSPCGISSSAPPPRPELSGFPKQTCGGSNPPGLQTWYPVFVNYSPERLEQIQSKFCRDAFPNDKRDPNRTYIQVASFRNRSVAEAFAQLIKKEFGSGEVGEAYSR